jgi:urease accessory protein
MRALVPLRLIARAAFVAAIAAAALVAAAGPAAAHTPNERLGDFWGGFLHPLTTLEHLPAVLALGILAGQQGRCLSRRALVALPVAFGAGSALAALAPLPGVVPILNRASFVVLGGLVAGAWRLPAGAALSLVAAAGLFHGWENSGAIPVGRRLLFGAGATAAVSFLLTIVAAVLVSLPAGWTRIVPRVLGSWIAAIGVLILALIP